MKREERHNFARDTFSRVAPSGWALALAASVEQGGHAPVCVVEHDDGRRGVFRCLLPDSDRTDIARFYRELRILTDRISHANVVPLLAWTQDDETQWYISELGVPLHSYWEERKSRTTDPNQLAHEAVRIIRQVADGLAVCHAEGVIHRDIKPKNVVMKLGVPEPWPMIIDFGVAFEEDDERISSANGTVGNTRYSPNLMQWRSDEIPPWIDVFELAQTLLWMLETKPQKHYWNRPVDWRYVRFDPGLHEVHASGIRALAAACSTQDVAPRDATEMLRLIESLLPTRNPDHKPDTDFCDLADQVLIGQSKAKLEEVDNQELHDACLPTATTFYRSVRSAIEEWHIAAAATLPIKKTTDESLEGLNLITAREDVHRCRKTLYGLQLGTGKSQRNFRIICQAIPPHRIPDEDGRMSRWRRDLPLESNIVTFIFQISSRWRDGQNPWITLASDGTPTRRIIRGDGRAGGSITAPEVTSKDTVVQDLVAQLSDRDMWQEIGRPS